MRKTVVGVCLLLACPLFAADEQKPADQAPVVKESIEVTASIVMKTEDYLRVAKGVIADVTMK